MIRYSHAADVPGMLIARGIGVTRAFSRHWHEEYQLVLVEAGAGEAFCRGAWHLNSQGSMLIVQPGVVHENRALGGGCTHRTMNVPSHLVAGDSKTLPYFPQLICDSDLITKFSAMHHAWDIPAPRFQRHSPDARNVGASRLERESRLSEFFSELRGRYGAPSPARTQRDRKAVRIARDFLAAHAAENPSLEALAAAAGMSQFHLLRLFRDETGMPPHTWLTRVRIMRARDLLARGHSIASVAAETGFADQSHLTRHFKRAVGVTPGAYRQRIDSKNVQDAAFAAA